MHAGSHYKLRRLASTLHGSEGLIGHTEQVDHEDHSEPEPIKEDLICLVFTRPPDEEAAVKYGSAVREMIEAVDLLHLTLIAMQDMHPLLEVLELANQCRLVANELAESVSVPILFAGSFAKYYLSFLKSLPVDRRVTIENVKYALGGGIPSIMHACKVERKSISEAKDVFEKAVKELHAILREHDGTDQHIAEFHPYALENVQILNLILQKLNEMDSFCRYYEYYFGFIQYQHLRRLLRTLERGTTARPAREEMNTMIDLWTQYDRFTLHFPTELELLKDYSQATNGMYRVRSTDFETSSTSSKYSQLSQKSLGCRYVVLKNLECLGKQPGRIKYWIRQRYLRWYRRIRFSSHPKASQVDCGLG